jgi:transposase
MPNGYNSFISMGWCAEAFVRAMVSPAASISAPSRMAGRLRSGPHSTHAKALMQMNAQLQHVVTDITAVTGLRLIRAIVSRAYAPEKLAEYRDVCCAASPPTIAAALTRDCRPEHIFALRQAVELYDFHQAKIAECDVEIETVLRRLNEERKVPEKPLPEVRHAKSRNEPRSDVRPALYTLLGADVTQIHGFGPYTVPRLVAECGEDMSKWPSAKHFASWLSLAPGNKISGAGCSALKAVGPPTGPPRSCA